MGAFVFRRQKKAHLPKEKNYFFLTATMIKGKFTPMAEHLVTSKITPESLQMVRMVAAKTGEKQYEVVRRLLEAEMQKLSLTTGVR